MRDTDRVSYQHLLVSTDGPITTITLNRPEKRNALAYDVLAELLDAKRRDGKTLTVRRIEEEAPRLGIRPDDVAVAIDSAGYRGPELDASRAVRVLTLGDSCTFGSPFAQTRKYGLMPTMHTIEIADGGNAAPVLRTQIV